MDGDPLSYTVVSGPSHGTLTAFDGSTGAFTYAPAAGYSGPDAFTFRASDGTADSNTATVSITVTANNHSPVARNDSGVTAEDTPVAVAVLANDTDPDGDALTVSAVTQPAHGTVAINADGTVTYTPAADFHGTDAFTYTADDGHGGTDTATVALTVRSVNDAPVANDADFSIDEDTALRGRLTATDPDGRPLTYRRVTGPAHGRLTLYPNGSFVYRPAADYNGLDSFTFKATDGALTSNVATVTITVRPVNDAPDATNDSYTTDAGDELTVPAAGVLANDTDVDGDALTAVLAAGPAHGRLTLNADGSYRYMPAAGFAGTDSFTYRANDGTVSGNPATVAIRVKAAVTAGQATGGGFVDGGARHFDLNVQSRARPGGFALSGTVAFRDEATGVTLDSTAIQSFRVDATGTRAVITGSATVNGRKGYTFTVIVQDLAEPGVGSRHVPDPDRRPERLRLRQPRRGGEPGRARRRQHPGAPEAVRPIGPVGERRDARGGRVPAPRVCGRAHGHFRRAAASPRSWPTTCPAAGPGSHFGCRPGRKSVARSDESGGPSRGAARNKSCAPDGFWLKPTLICARTTHYVALPAGRPADPAALRRGATAHDVALMDVGHSLNYK